jgi:dolichol-phosphate mannosyltransferase
MNESRPSEQAIHDVIIVIPTYNEADTLATTVHEVRATLPLATLLIVDDGSPDGTGDIADELAQQDSRTHVLHRALKAGLGSAYLAGFTWALERQPQFIVEMDADGSHRAEDLHAMLMHADSADLTIGSRWIPGGAVRNWSWPRQLLSRAGNAYVRFMLRMPVRDATAGLRVFKAATLAALDLTDVSSAGYCFQVDMTRRVHLAGLTIREHPIIFVERRAGASKMSNAIVREALWRVTVWGIADRFGRRRSR